MSHLFTDIFFFLIDIASCFEFAYTYIHVIIIHAYFLSKNENCRDLNSLLPYQEYIMSGP